MEVVTALLVLGVYDPGLALFFEGHHTYTKRNASSFLAFYQPLLDVWPQGVDNCSLVPNATRLAFREMDFAVDRGVVPSRKGLQRAQAEREFSRASRTSMWQACKLTSPLLHERARSKMLPLQPVRYLTFVRRRKSARRIQNPDEVEAELRVFAEAWRLSLRSVYLETLRADEQIALAAQTELLVAYHGSGVGAFHVWMRPGSTVIEVSPPRWPYCLFSVCANATRKSYIFSSVHGDEPANVWKPGGFDSIKVPFGPQAGRKANLSAALRVALALRRGEHIEPNACGRRMVQVWEPPQDGPPLPDKLLWSWT